MESLNIMLPVTAQYYDGFTITKEFSASECDLSTILRSFCWNAFELDEQGNLKPTEHFLRHQQSQTQLQSQLQSQNQSQSQSQIQLQHQSQSTVPFLRYIDLEGDMITIASEQDWNEAKLSVGMIPPASMQLIVNAPSSAQKTVENPILHDVPSSLIISQDDAVVIQLGDAGIENLPQFERLPNYEEKEEDQVASIAKVSPVQSLVNPEQVEEQAANEEQQKQSHSCSSKKCPENSSACSSSSSSTETEVSFIDHLINESHYHRIIAQTALKCKMQQFKDSEFARKSKEVMREAASELREFGQDIKPVARGIAKSIVETLKEFGSFTEKHFNILCDKIVEALRKEQLAHVQNENDGEEQVDLFQQSDQSSSNASSNFFANAGSSSLSSSSSSSSSSVLSTDSGSEQQHFILANADLDALKKDFAEFSRLTAELKDDIGHQPDDQIGLEDDAIKAASVQELLTFCETQGAMEHVADNEQMPVSMGSSQSPADATTFSSNAAEENIDEGEVKEEVEAEQEEFVFVQEMDFCDSSIHQNTSHNLVNDCNVEVAVAQPTIHQSPMELPVLENDMVLSPPLTEAPEPSEDENSFAAAILEPEAVSLDEEMKKWNPQLAALAEMGFYDFSALITLLEKHHGEMQNVISELLTS